MVIGGSGGGVFIVEGVVKVEFVGQGDDLLDLTDVAFEGFEHGICIKVPEFDGAIV